MQQAAAVIFDYGGVLTVPVRHSIRAWVAADNIDPASLARTLKSWMSVGSGGSPIHRLETGDLAVPDFERLFAAELRTLDATPVDPTGLLSRLFAGLHLDPNMFALAADLREVGIKVALLSNSWGNTYPRERIDAIFDQVVISGEVGLRKPLAPIYEVTLRRLGVEPERAVFLDDAEPNVIGARAVGLLAWQHIDPASTRSALAALVPGLSPRITAGANA